MLRYRERNSPLTHMKRYIETIERVVGAPAFEFAIIAIIIFNGALLGMGTSPGVE